MKRTPQNLECFFRFSAVVACVVIMLVKLGEWICNGILPWEGQAMAVDAIRMAPCAMVMIGSALDMDFYETAKVDGDVKSRFHTLLQSSLTGTIDGISVKKGTRVEKGKTQLFSVNSRELRHDAEAAKIDLIMAYSLLDDGERRLAATASRLATAEKDLAWLRPFHEDGEASLDDLRAAENALAALVREREADEAVLELCRNRAREAETALYRAEKRLRGNVMLAPVDGTVSGCFAAAGQRAEPNGKVLFRIEDGADLWASGVWPSRLYDQIRVGDMVQVSVGGVDIGEFPITRKSAISAVNFTFEVRADIPGDGELVVPGAACVMSARINRTRGVGVLWEAVHYFDYEHWVFVPDGTSTRMVRVEIGMESEGWVQLLDSPIRPGDRVVFGGYSTVEIGEMMAKFDRGAV